MAMIAPTQNEIGGAVFGDTLPDLGPVLGPLGSALPAGYLFGVPKISLWGPKQIQRHVQSSRHVPIFDRRAIRIRHRYRRQQNIGNI
jgi:hypothetical protein